MILVYQNNIKIYKKNNLKQKTIKKNINFNFFKKRY
jgi:hypothetical protein